MIKEDNNCKATPQEELMPKKEKINYKFQTKFTSRDTEDYKNWFSFGYFKSYFKFQFDCWGYFDPRPQINSNVTSVLVLLTLIISLFTMTFTWFHLLILPFLFFGYGDFFLHLPFNTGKINESENPSYGFYMYHIDPFPGKINFPTCFIWQWGNYKSTDMPWANTWIRTSILIKTQDLMKDGKIKIKESWVHETKGNTFDFYKEEWKKLQYMVEYDFLDKSDNTIIPTKVYVEEREWRQHWLKWTSLFANVRKTIDVNFSKEVGSRKGSWKGGTTGCGYLMNKGETALECIKRMEKERTFR
ncbi:MAG: hypothetical protein ACJAVA_000339 [Flavobacteriaceae bacterium]|jgi:hypothetical protein